MMSPTVLSLSDWIALVGLPAAAILAVIGNHYHSAVRNPEARATLVQRLTSSRARDVYHDYLRGALNWVDEKIGPSPFARAHPNGRRAWGVRSLGFCVALSLVYSIVFYLIGWMMDGPGRLGQITMIETPQAPAWVPDWLLRFATAALVTGFGLFVSLTFRTAASWHQWMVDWLTEHLADSKWRVWRHVSIIACSILVIAVAVAVVLGVYIVVGGTGIAAFAALMVFLVGALAAAGIGPSVRTTQDRLLARVGMGIGFIGLVLIAGDLDPRLAVVFLLFMLALPCLNGLLDWLSLSASRWFGRWIIAERAAAAAAAITVCLAIADLVAAVAFAFLVAWLLAFGVEATGLAFGLALDLGGYVKVAAEAPWTNGLWATLMVLSTLVPTAIHFILALGAVLMAWSGNPLSRLAARRLESSNEADYLLPQLYLSFGWMVMALVVSALLIWGLAQAAQLFTMVFEPGETLPGLLRDTAWHGIDTARVLFGPVPQGPG